MGHVSRFAIVDTLLDLVFGHLCSGKLGTLACLHTVVRVTRAAMAGDELLGLVPLGIGDAGVLVGRLGLDRSGMIGSEQESQDEQEKR